MNRNPNKYVTLSLDAGHNCEEYSLLGNMTSSSTKYDGSNPDHATVGSSGHATGVP
jgi:hypothetical protein